MSLPHVLKDFNLYIDGRGYAGLVEEITLPKLELKTEEYEAAGMAGSVELDLGMSGMQLDFTLSEYSTEVIKLWGIADAGGINARFLGAAVAGDGSSTDAIEISARGRWKTMDFGSTKKKELAKLKVEMPLTYYRYNLNSATLIEIDMISGKRIVNGTDLSAALLSALGITA